VSRILLDTHLLLWAVSEPRTLPTEARRQIEEAEVFVSAASIWARTGTRRQKWPIRRLLEVWWLALTPASASA
jgi:PIN domain nuclease of toxin-antitoxin system